MKDKIRMILREGIVNNKINRIAIFDFDGTLIDTDTPESGKPLWQKEFGFEWPFKGWWGRPESLDSRIFFQKNQDFKPELLDKGLNQNIFDNTVIAKTFSAYKEESSRPDTLTILLTGRHSGVGNLVAKILSDRGITFDDYIYKTGNLDTADFKIEVLNNLVSKNPDLEEITMYEDRNDHIIIFKRFGEQLVKDKKIDTFNLYQVTNNSIVKL